MARRDPKKNWVMGNFKMTMDYVATIMQDWQDDWKVDVPYTELSDSNSKKSTTNEG